MPRMKSTYLGSFLLLLLAVPLLHAASETVVLHDAKGENVGTATLSSMKGGGVKIKLDLKNLPPGEHAKIAFVNYAWRILRWNDEWHGNWTGNYPTAEVALAALRQELLGIAAAV